MEGNEKLVILDMKVPFASASGGLQNAVLTLGGRLTIDTGCVTITVHRFGDSIVVNHVESRVQIQRGLTATSLYGNANGVEARVQFSPLKKNRVVRALKNAGFEVDQVWRRSH